MARIVISPNAKNMPADWRTPWQQFDVLKNLGRKLHEPVSTWRLEAPKGFGKMLDRRWTLTYTFKNHRYVAYIGIDGKQAAIGIKEIVKGFKVAVEGNKAYDESMPKPATEKKPVPPIYNPALAQKMQDEWNIAIKLVKDRRGAEAFNRDHKYMLWFMRQRAGILNMSMREYMFNHPHASYWLTPPHSEAELRRRQEQFRRIVEDKERNSRNPQNEDW
jgi:hypothetical protein